MIEIHTPPLASETIAHLGAFEIRNSMLMAWFAVVVLIAIALTGKIRGYRMVPDKFQSVLELVVGGLFDFFNSVLSDPQRTRKVFPLVGTLFLFIVTANWMGILPGVGTITIDGVHEGQEMALPVLRSMNADVNMTLALALTAVACVQLYGMAELGFFHYANKFIVAPWKDFTGSFVGVLEIIGEFSRMISFSFRLFGNIFAGEVLLVVVALLVPYIAPIPFLGLEIFVGVVQGLVFSMLTLVFVNMAMTSHHDTSHEMPDITKLELSRRVLKQS